MTLAILELTTWSELGALIGIVSVVCSVSGAALYLWINSKFINKDAYYNDKREAASVVKAIEDKAEAVAAAQALAKEPLTTMQKSFEDMKVQLEKLTSTITTMRESVGAGLHEIDKRTVALETAEVFASVRKRRARPQR